MEYCQDLGLHHQHHDHPQNKSKPRFLIKTLDRSIFREQTLQIRLPCLVLEVPTEDKPHSSTNSKSTTFRNTFRTWIRSKRNPRKSGEKVKKGWFTLQIRLPCLVLEVPKENRPHSSTNSKSTTFRNTFRTWILSKRNPSRSEEKVKKGWFSALKHVEKRCASW